ncbi:MAG: prepilin-type N-terminal cleavage/methylation domain-containing protein [Elusimicrobiota bacterium]
MSILRRLRDRRGYSAAELMIVVAIVGILAMIGPELMMKMQNFYMLTTARAEIQRDARATLDLVNRFLRQAKYNTIQIDTPSGQGPYSRIRFEHIDGTSYEFRQDGANLVQTEGGRTTIIAKNIVYIAFTFPRSDYPRLVSVSITTGKNIQLGQRKELELTVQKIRVMN